MLLVFHAIHNPHDTCSLPVNICLILNILCVCVMRSVCSRVLCCPFVVHGWLAPAGNEGMNSHSNHVKLRGSFLRADQTVFAFVADNFACGVRVFPGLLVLEGFLPKVPL